MDAERILMSFSRYECRMVTSDTASAVSRSCQEWGEEIPSFGFTTCALRWEIENVVKHVVVVGYLYSLVNMFELLGG
jgi:hypothetical protein